MKSPYGQSRTDDCLYSREDKVVSDSISCQHPYTEIHSTIGRIVIENPGTYALTLSSKLAKPKPFGPEIWQACREASFRAISSGALNTRSSQNENIPYNGASLLGDRMD